MQMQFGSAPAPVAKPAPAPAPAKPAADSGAEAARDAQLREAAFEKALADALDKKHAALNPHPGSAWLAHPLAPVVPSENSGAIEAASGINTEATNRPSFLMPLPTRRGEDALELGASEAAQAPQAPEGPEAISLVVEPGLPPVQPLTEKLEGPVPLADFPQVVVGQVRQLQQEGRGITQLEFEISPPHVGPINLQVSVENGAVNVQLVALTMQAKQALESQVGNIQSILQAHHITPGQIKVVTASAGKSGTGGAGNKGDQPGFGFAHGGRRRAGNGEQMTIET